LKGAALIFGLLAGLLGAGAIALGNLASGLNLALSLGDDLLAKSILYGILVVGLVGTGLVLAWPKVGGVVMVLCALGWTAAALVAGHGGLLFAALPITFAGAGGLVATFVKPRLDADDEDDDDLRPQPIGRRRLADADFDDDRRAPSPRMRGPAGRVPGIRSEPGFDVDPHDGQFCEVNSTYRLARRRLLRFEVSLVLRRRAFPSARMNSLSR